MGQIATPATGVEKSRKALDRAVIRFAGDSGDGMQLTGEQFTTESAWAGNDLATLPNFPAEIRAPAGTLFGVSSFQLQFGSQRVYTPGDRLDCLVAMNPAALKVHRRDLKTGGFMIVNTQAFDKRNLDKAGWGANRLDEPALAERYRLHKVDMTGLTHEAIKDLPLNTKEKDRTKNFFALGLVSWIYTRPLEPTLDWIGKKFTKSPQFAEANTRVLKAGHAFGETAEFFEEAYKTEQADLMQALYGRNSESPVVVLAPATPGDCFYVAYEAVRIAVKYMVPVIVLSDGFLANGSEPWLIPDPNTLPPIDIQFRTEKEGFFPYLRDPATARPGPGAAGVPQGAGAGDQQRPARARAAGGVPRGRRWLHPRAGAAAGQRRHLRGHHPTGESEMSPTGAGAAATPKYTKKDFESDQDVRWCPGCGDYAILSAIQKSMPDLGIPKENIVFISGIGCSSRFPYNMNTNGFHTVHARAPALATGLTAARPELKIFVVTGDGDGLSMGGNHMLHVLRRNVDVTVLLFNNRIYGLTKGQYSPTSELGKVTKSTPLGSADRPVNPLAFALGCGATFVGRTVDRNIPHMDEMLKRAAAHRGTAFLEILQNCNVYNDLAWNVIYDKESKVLHELRLEHGKPLMFGPPDARKAVVMQGVMPTVVDAKSAPESALWIHDEKNVNAAKLLADLFAPDFPVPIGVLADIEAPIYDNVLLEQEQRALSERGPGDIAKLLTSGDTWKISSEGG